MSSFKRAPICALALLLLASACAPAAPSQSSALSPQSSTPKRIVAAIMSDPPTISHDFIIAGSGTIPGGDALEELLNAGLTHPDERGQLHPQLAEAVPSLQNGLWKLLPDGRMETTWRIRDNARWHDGVAFTSADLLFTATLSQDRELPVFREPEYPFVESIQAPDPRTVVVTWKRPYIAADGMFSFARPKHVLEPAYLEDKQSVFLQPYWTDAYVGAGPFKLREWVRGSHLIVEAYDQYVLGRPRVDEIKVKFIPDSNALIANILAGEVELTLGRNLSLQQAIQLRDQWRDGALDVGFTNWIALWPQLLNPNPPAMLDVTFRRALFHAIDREQIVETIQYGMVPVAHAFVSPTEPVYEDIAPSIVRYDYDPQRATRLIEAVGYSRGPDGVFRDPGGQRLQLEVRTSGGDDAHEAGVFTIADHFKRVGIAAEPFLIPQAQRDDREYNSTYPGVRLWRLPNDLRTVDRYQSDKAPLPENRFSGGNRSRYMNPQFDSFIDRYLVTIPLPERVQALAEIVRHMTDQVTVMGLWYNTESIMIGKRLRNVTNKKTGNAFQAWNAHEWDVQ